MSTQAQHTSPESSQTESPVIGSMFGFFMGEKPAITEIEAEVVCTHFLFEGPDMGDDE